MTQEPRIYVAVRPDEFDRLFEPAVAADLRSLGTVEFAPDSGRAPVPDDVAERYDVLVTSWSTERFPPERLDGSRLRMAVHAAGSVRGLFPRTALENGLTLVQGGAEAMAEAVAEMSVTLTMVLLRNVHIHDRGLQGGRDWAAAGNGTLGRAVRAQRVGVVGLSRVGRHYAQMMRGLGVTRLTAFDPYAAADDAAGLGVRLVELDELFADSDVVCVAAPATPETRRLVGARELSRLPDGAVLVNAARSAVVNEAALLAELRPGRIRAGLDVFDDEPLPPDSAFLGLDNVVLTPHVAGGTVQARAMQGRVVVDEIGRFGRGEPLRHQVTPDIYDRLA
ncbi:phosphoglycerate dehydrogenase-like enzyme [Haloactinopolyspora alba]|uniref:Phosphoglycerate dehydrogenase-like enzyme n=1 Tax=Haloactinopolyspora alba TaxID=648780 RepID=A0A2P8DT99_9ACTN|nr:hydroxyacid dehydrogenase [Haloactinopolyspora alba]PSL00438.1 phosphoglycerate dehydrogenase-like enzyme [Haloactinopolyspora alba]